MFACFVVLSMQLHLVPLETVFRSALMRFGGAHDRILAAQPEKNTISLHAPAPVPHLVASGDVDHVELSAHAAFGFDRATGKVLYAKNENERVSIASITKLMTVLVAYEQVHGDLDREVKIRPGISQIGGSLMGLLSGERVTIRDLMYGALVASGNDAALTLAEVTGGSEKNFIQLMNIKAQELGLSRTHFATPVGLDDPENYSTAFDISQFAEYVFRHKDLQDMVGTRAITIVSRDPSHTRHPLQNTDKLLAEGVVFAGKTGFTDNAGLCLVSAARQNGHDVVNVVLGSEDRAEDTHRLVDWEFSHYTWS